MSEYVTKLSFGIPVRGAAKSLPKLIDSLRSQSYGDFEIVVCDNASTDDTRAVLESLAADEPRLRYFLNPEDIGLVANFNRVFELSRGEYFRWMGGDDWLNPGYAQVCVDALDQAPGSIGVTTFQAHWDGAGDKEYEEYAGPRVDSDDASERFRVCMQLMTSSYLYFDPMYAMYRSSVLAKTQRLRPVVRGDQILAAELALLGPYAHVPQCLSNRGRPRTDAMGLRRLLTPPGHAVIRDSLAETLWELRDRIVRTHELSPQQRRTCERAALNYAASIVRHERVGTAKSAVVDFLKDKGVPVSALKRQLRRF